jgi:hypothetical protein
MCKAATHKKALDPLAYWAQLARRARRGQRASGSIKCSRTTPGLARCAVQGCTNAVPYMDVVMPREDTTPWMEEVRLQGRGR